MKTIKTAILLIFLSSSLMSSAQIIGKLLHSLEAKPAKPEEIKGDDISGPLHQKNMGKIVFAKKAESLIYKKEVESEFQNEFELSEPIYLRAYYDNTLYNHVIKFAPRSERDSYIKKDAYFRTKFYFDEVLITEDGLNTKTNNSAYKDSDLDMITMRTTFDDALKTAKKNEWVRFKNNYENFIKKCDAKLTPGKHTVRIEIYAAYPNVEKRELLATGSFTLKINENVFDPNDEQFCAPKAKMIDKGLETKIAKAFNELGTTRELKEVRISTDKWEIIRNSNSGVIIGRRLKAYIIATSKEKCCYEEIGFVQDYDGAAYAENFYAYGYSGVYYIPCGCIPK